MYYGFKKLTRQNMRKLAVGGVICEGNIEYQKKANGDGVFRINLTEGDQRIHETIGSELHGVTLDDAVRAVAKRKTELREGRLQLRKSRKDALIFKTAAQDYLQREAEIGGRDLKRKAAVMKHYLIPFFSDMPLNKLTSFDIERYKSKRLSDTAIQGGDRTSSKARRTGKAQGGQRKQTSPATVNRELAVLSHFLSRILEWGWVGQKTAVVKRLKVDNTRIHYLTTEEANRLLEVADEDEHPFIWLFIAIALETSMRKSEILSIRLEHIDFERRVIFLPKAKAGAREQPITTNLAGILKGYIERCQAEGLVREWLFTANSASGHVMSLTLPFRRVVAAAGLDPSKITPHVLRHTAITHLVQAGIDLPTVQRISGHKTLSMVMRYSHQNGQHIQEAMDVLENRYRASPRTQEEHKQQKRLTG